MAGVKVYRFPYFYPKALQCLAYGNGIVPNIKNNRLAKFQIPFLCFFELIYTMKIVRREHIDIVNSQWFVPQSLAGAICKKLLRTTHVSTIHAADIFCLERLPFKRIFGDFIVKNSDTIIVVSSYIRDVLLGLTSKELREEAKQKIIVIPMGVYTNMYKNNDASKSDLKRKYDITSEYVLLFLGRLAEKKGIPYLINALPKILDKYENISLLICGDGLLKADLETLVKDLGLESNVRFAGFVTDDEKYDYIKLSDIIIIPSIVTESGDTEGLPVVILEGLAAGKPVIASNVSGIKDVIKNSWNGILVEQKSSEQIATQVLRLLNDEELRIYLGENALISSANYDWKTISDMYIDIFKRSM